MTDKEISERIFTDLAQLPDELRLLEMNTADLRAELRAAESALKEAQLAAQINTPAVGANAEERKLNKEKAIGADPAVKAAQKTVMDLEASISISEIDAKALSRKFNAAMALAEFQSARLNLMARIQKGETK